jgi:hypothetical protein
MSAPWCCLAEGAMAARESKQREGLIVEIEPRVEHFAIEIDDRRNGAVGADEISGEEIERMPRGVAPRPVPAKPAGLAIGEGLPRDAARTMRPRQRLAVEIDRLVEPAIDAVSPDLPPQGKRNVEQPAPQRRGLAGEIAHATGSLRACGIPACTAEQVIPGTGERKIPCRQVRSNAIGRSPPYGSGSSSCDPSIPARPSCARAHEAIWCAAAQSAMSSWAQRGRHEVREKVGCAGEHRAAERSELAGVIGVVGWPTVIRQCGRPRIVPRAGHGAGTGGRVMVSSV